MSLRDLPDVFTIPEAAALLGIARNTAYDQARRWRETGGREGLPVLTLGSRLLVSKAQLERMLGIEAADRYPGSDEMSTEANAPGEGSVEKAEESGTEGAGNGGAGPCPPPDPPGGRVARSTSRPNPSNPLASREPSQLSLFNPEPPTPNPSR